MARRYRIVKTLDGKGRYLEKSEREDPGNSRNLTVRVWPEDVERMDKLADELRCSRADIVRAAVEELVEAQA